uniref:Uncharacterized protein n=1 Tax=Anguilla anguilla TaxID=7936 RepID=A0A0E9X738_ANGAN
MLQLRNRRYCRHSKHNAGRKESSFGTVPVSQPAAKLQCFVKRSYFLKMSDHSVTRESGSPPAAWTVRKCPSTEERKIKKNLLGPFSLTAIVFPLEKRLQILTKR